MATSNVMAGFHFGIPIAGTLAHSMIMSYETESDTEHSRMLKTPDGGEVDLLKEVLIYREKLGWTGTKLKELYAFVSFATSYPTTFSSLVDSYSTKESGLINFLLVCLALTDHGYQPISIRLDSGDLAELSIHAKQLFKSVGEQFNKDFTKIKIVASNDINEDYIDKLI